MLEIFKQEIGKRLLKIEVHGVDLYTNSQFVESMHAIVRSLLKGNDNQKVVFMFRGEEEIFLEEKELLFFRNFIPKYFKDNGEYCEVRRRDESMFDGFAWLNKISDVEKMVVWAWKYFYAVSVFVPTTHLSWDYLIQNHNEFFKKDVDAKRMFDNNYIDWILIKGLGADNLAIVQRTTSQNPDVDLVLQSLS